MEFFFGELWPLRKLKSSYTRSLQAVPGVAERWEVSPDGKTYSFHLRADAKWSDGSPLTAEDFVRSWQRTLTPSTGSQYNYQLYPIKNAQAFAEGKITDFSQVGVRAADPRALVVELENPTPYFIQLCAFPTLHPLPVSLIEKLGDDWVKPGKQPPHNTPLRLPLHRASLGRNSGAKSGNS